MSTYIILPGGWAGGWQSPQLARQLAAAGQIVFAPVFSGPNEADGATLVEIRAQAVLLVLQEQDVRNAVLVGFDRCGEVLSRVTSLAPGRVEHIVCVDVDIPEHCAEPNTGLGDLPRHTYLRCAAGNALLGGPSVRSGQRARAAGWDYGELPEDGSSRVAQPEELASKLIALAH